MSRLSPIERFENKIKKLPNGCWEWQGSTIYAGYGKFRIGSVKDRTRRTVQAHRWYYEQIKKVKVPKELQMDHLEPVTQSVNQRRGLNGIRREYCMKGLHKMEGDNIYIKKDGRRNCKACKNERSKVYKKNRRKSAKRKVT